MTRRRICRLSLILLFCSAAVIAAPAQSTFFTSLYSFCPLGFPCPDGFDALDGLVQARDGNFYGTTVQGGTGGGYCGTGCGTIFKITPTGELTTLHSFDVSDGESPGGGLVQASDGNFYGTTSTAGAHGYGTVFKIAAGGTLTTLYGFCSQLNCTDGATPYAGLVQASDGNFYGTTWVGGFSDKCSMGCGTVFKISTGGMLTTLYRFCAQTNCADGVDPNGLVEARDGSLYGTTASGGGLGVGGTVFRITPSGTLTTLYTFCSQPNCTDGRSPFAGLVQGTDGNFYGTTPYGGANNYGTVFKINAEGTLTTLYSFCAQNGCPDGAYPFAALLRATDGNFYGTTVGTVFEITPAGVLTTLHHFNGADGADVQAGLVQATDGNFYGTTGGGGAYSYGTVFRLGVVRACATCRP